MKAQRSEAKANEKLSSALNKIKEHESEAGALYHWKRKWANANEELTKRNKQDEERLASQATRVSTITQTLTDPQVRMLEHDLGNSEIANDLLREEVIKLTDEIQKLKNQKAERALDGLQSSLIEPDSKPKSQEQKEKEAQSQIEKYELEQQLRQLEARLAVVNSRNEDLEAEVQEANHWVYERGPVQAEIKDLRQLYASHLAEIARLKNENERLQKAVRDFQNSVGNHGSRQQIQMVERPE